MSQNLHIHLYMVHSSDYDATFLKYLILLKIAFYFGIFNNYFLIAKLHHSKSWKVYD